MHVFCSDYYNSLPPHVLLEEVMMFALVASFVAAATAHTRLVILNVSHVIRTAERLCCRHCPPHPWPALTRPRCYRHPAFSEALNVICVRLHVNLLFFL